MPSKKAIALGCGIAGAVCLIGVVAVVLFVAYVAQDVQGAGISVNGPADVVVGQTFDLTVTVTNERPRKALALSDIDIAEEYLEGFTVSKINPKPKSTQHVPIDDSRSFSFGVSIPAGESRDFIFTLRAEKSGLYRGDVDMCEGARFTTGMAQTNVKEP